MYNLNTTEMHSIQTRLSRQSYLLDFVFSAFSKFRRVLIKASFSALCKVGITSMESGNIRCFKDSHTVMNKIKISIIPSICNINLLFVVAHLLHLVLLFLQRHRQAYETAIHQYKTGMRWFWHRVHQYQPGTACFLAKWRNFWCRGAPTLN